MSFIGQAFNSPMYSVLEPYYSMLSYLRGVGETIRTNTY